MLLIGLSASVERMAEIEKPAVTRHRIGPRFAIALAVFGFFAIGLVFLPRLGFEYDEVMFASLIFHPSKSLFAARISHHFVPLMEMSYIGALKVWLYWPLLKVLHPGVYAIRLPMLILSSLTVLLVAETVRRRTTVGAAVFTALLLATDINFLLCSTFDWGPVAVQNFLLSVAVYCILVHRKTVFGLSCAAFALGLALWDKAIFLWILTGLCLSGLTFGFGVLKREASARKVAAAAIAFTIAILPLLIYNVKRPNQTLGGNAHFTSHELRPKFTFVRFALNGQAFQHFFADDSAPAHHTADRNTIRNQSPVVGLSHSPSSWRFPAFGLLLVAGIGCARGEKRRLILWLTCAVVLAWLQSAMTVNAGVFVHHVVIFYPALFVAVGIAVAEIAYRLGRYGTLFLTVAGVLLCGAGLNTIYAQFRDLQQFSPTTFWTDADEGLAQYLVAHPARQILIADWGIAMQADVRTNGSLPIEEISFSLKDGHCTPQEARGWAQSRSPIVLHTANHEMFPQQREKLAALAKASGLAVVPMATVSDRGGHPMFEIDELAFTPGV